MTLQQLKYVITVAEAGTVTEAADKLKESAFRKKEKISLDMPGRFWNRQQFLKINIRGVMEERNHFACLHNIIPLRSMRLWTW